MYLFCLQIQQGDSEERMYSLHGLKLQEMRVTCGTDSNFIAQLARMMFSITERCLLANTEGRAVHGEPRMKLSPKKRRINEIVARTALLILPNKGELRMYKYVRSIIDQTHRNYRTLLTLRKQHLANLADKNSEEDDEDVNIETDDSD